MKTRLPAQVELGHALDAHGLHFAAISATSASSMRFEKPHSLSYQLADLHQRAPITLVSVASKIDERGSWLKSTETSGAVL